jgi:hypothetical protein
MNVLEWTIVGMGILWLGMFCSYIKSEYNRIKAELIEMAILAEEGNYDYKY